MKAAYILEYSNIDVRPDFYPCICCYCQLDAFDGRLHTICIVFTGFDLVGAGYVEHNLSRRPVPQRREL